MYLSPNERVVSASAFCALLVIVSIALNNLGLMLISAACIVLMLVLFFKPKLQRRH